MEATIGFKPGVWQKEINVSDFIKNNYQDRYRFQRLAFDLEAMTN